MNDRENKQDLGDIGLLMLVIGVYLMLVNVIRRRATSWVTAFFGSLAALGVEGFGAFVLYGHLLRSKTSRPLSTQPALDFFFAVSLVLYVLLVIQAFREQRRAIDVIDE
ncbi:MAG: hypothetical protein GYA21_16145 [Myxococcales bacterium]|nr:hypothetical protein [Myxococcales bacterium]